MSAALRPYQIKAVDESIAALESNRSTLLVMPTGTGKTVVFAQVAKRMRPRGRVLVLAHREELINQAVRKIEEWAGLTTGVEMGASTCSFPIGRPDVVVASVQSLCRPARLVAYGAEAFGLIIVDEAHHACADTYRSILDYFTGAKVLGVTATPDRADGAGLGGVFESVAYSYEIGDAIREGFLAPVKQKQVVVDSMDFSKVRRTAGDLNEADLEAVLMEESNLHAVAKPTLDFAGERQSLVFATTVAHAQSLAAVMNRYRRDSAQSIDGGMDRRDRARRLAEFADGKFQFLVNCMLLTEGFDMPSISCVSMARPTSSRSLYAQMVGRGTRLCENKRDLLVLDFVGNSGKHRLVSALDILEGNLDDRVRAFAEAASEEGQDVLGAIATGRRAVEAEDERQRVAAADARRRSVTANVSARVVDLNAWDFAGFSIAAARSNGIEPTDKQIGFLQRSGMPAEELDRAQCSALIDRLMRRRDLGLCTYKQAKTLAKYGLSSDLTFAQASALIDAIAGNGWKLPPSLATTSAS